LFALTLLVSNVVWGVETILSNIASSATANWTFTNNVTTQAIQQGGYWLLQATGSAKDEIISEAINVSSYSTFITSGNINLGTINSTNLKIRFNNAGTADKGVRMKNILLKGDLAPSNTVSTPSITATGALNTTDNYFNTASITLSSTTSGASIYYTTNGDVPTAASTLYGAPFDITSTTTIKAIATKSGMDNSNVASKTITITTVSAPTITVTQVSVPDMTAVTGLSDSEILTVTGAVLNADVAISIDGTNASMFSISPESLTNTNGSASGSVTVTYSPTAPGTHTATLRFNSAGATEVTRTLNGTSAMATPVATDATGISTTGFTANWNAVVGASEY
ncbi:chitobiase/beta-hexosaminidase C-terminal domain-containing protein, partial [bacterium]|nr:chitobiase/beta-hexosaminidase C-terminal domain-containing protein [bacterium]